MLYLTKHALYDDAGRRFDPASLAWTQALSASFGSAEGVPATEAEAVRWLKRSGTPIRPPVAVIGPREATEEQTNMARAVGRGLASLELTLLCGGRQGVMEAACQGAAEGGGLSIGLLPEGEWQSGNPYVSVPIATGIGLARNALIARAALCVIAVGGGLGTLSEIALALQFGKPVLTLCHAPDVPGCRTFAGWDDLEQALCRTVLQLD
jgi:uncharacterized protein (TIGR00725 family)